jgi:hypothetical protein
LRHNRNRFTGRTQPAALQVQNLDVDLLHPPG